MTPLEQWVTAVQAELDLPDPVDVRTLLALAREVAHGVERPAAPVTTYLTGLAVARGADVADVVSRLTQLAASWPAPSSDQDGPAGGAAAVLPATR